MAEAMLAHLLPEPLRQQVDIESAGAFAVDGRPATPEAVAALAKAGIVAPEHRSRRLTRELVEAADLILAMGPAHRAAIQELAPEKADAVHLLHAFHTTEPRAEDVVHDPIGGSAEVYDECLARIRRHLERVRRHLQAEVTGSTR